MMTQIPVEGLRVNPFGDPEVDTPMVVSLDELRPYELNPRMVRNPLYDEIKASIRERGLDAPPAITRRPGQSHFIIRNGGNTRLSILKELWAQTKEERFFKIHCLFRPWQSEIVALTGHLAENELHGSLSFIERALAVDKAREIYEQDAQQKLTQTQLVQRLSADGYPVSQTLVSQMQEAVSYLLEVIPNMLYGGLSRKRIERILRLRRSARSTWKKYAQEKPEQQLDFMGVFQDVLARFDEGAGGTFDFNRFEDELTGRMAQILGCTYALMALELSEKCEWQQLIESPPAAELDIEEVPLLTKNPALTVQLMQEQDVLALPLPSKEDGEPVVVTRSQVRPANNPENSPADSPMLPVRERQTPGEELQEPQVLQESQEPQVSEKSGGQAESTVSQAQSCAAMSEASPVASPVALPVVSPVDTTPRLQAIESMVGALVGDVAPQQGMDMGTGGHTSVQSIPLQAGGLYPVTDIWHISAGVDEVGKLRVHIGQLALEIADEMGLCDAVQTLDGEMGFSCQRLSGADKSAQTLLFFMSALSGCTYAGQGCADGGAGGGAGGGADGGAQAWIRFVAELLVGAGQRSEVTRLSDVAFVKLLRMLRLMRRFNEHGYKEEYKEEMAGNPL
jgi:ParB family protein of integrating conjugative element (PFGI_1 class)